MLRSSKFDKQECFTVAAENQWKPIVRPGKVAAGEPNESERQTFMAALVYFNRPIRRFIHVDDDNVASMTRAVSRNPRPGQSSYTTEDMRKMTLDYPELVQFMSTLARDQKDEGQGIRVSRLYKAKEVQNDFRWEISFLYVGDYKYCERIRRHHKQNNV